MLKYVVATLCGFSLAGSVYMTGWGGSCTGSDAMCDDGSCCAPAVGSAGSVESASGSAMSNAVDVKNVKCLVSGEDPMGAGQTVVYKGKIYHLCCDACVAPFNKDPEKYVKAFEADPTKFGLKH